MRKFSLLFGISLFLISCCPPTKTTVMIGTDQYGVIYDNQFGAPISYRAKYIEPESAYCQNCYISEHVLDNLYFQRDSKALQCSPEGLHSDFFIYKQSK